MPQPDVSVAISVPPTFAVRPPPRALLDEVLENIELLEQNAAQTATILRQLLARVEQDAHNLMDLQQRAQAGGGDALLPGLVGFTLQGENIEVDQAIRFIIIET